ncbi:MAG: type II toxin-antitoxin system HicB family antitoxin [Gemmatimonadota bacterium]
MRGKANTGLIRFPVGLEEGPDGSAHVHSLTVPGCVASGRSKEAALEAFSRVLGQWLDFLAGQGEPVPPADRELEITVDEWIATDARVASGESDVCFDADRRPLVEPELLRGLRLLGGLRGRLLPHIRRARDEDLEGLGPPEANVRRIVDELARAQWWTLTRLGASPLAEVPARAVARLDTAMALIVQNMGALTAEERARQVEIEGEEWTARKVLRRLLWLEWSLGTAALRTLADGKRELA